MSVHITTRSSHGNVQPMLDGADVSLKNISRSMRSFRRLSRSSSRNLGRRSSLIDPVTKTKMNYFSLAYVNYVRETLNLLVTEPGSSIYAALFFISLIFMILASNILMIGQTCPGWTYIPTTCELCSEDSSPPADIPCVCEPMPLPITNTLQDYCMYFFAIEWILRVSCFVPPPIESPASTSSSSLTISSYRAYVTSVTRWSKIFLKPSTIIDGLAVFPYFFERYFDDVDGLMAIRLLRIFRLFLLLRLGSFSSIFQVLVKVLLKSLISFYILFMGLLFGAAFFGSLIFFTEMGEWKYTTYTDPPSYRMMRPTFDGLGEEPTPFVSIPASFWWFIVTATTVGYGDVFPTSAWGKIVAVLTMVTGIVVVAFPVSIFCELWSSELSEAAASMVNEEEEKNDHENNAREELTDSTMETSAQDDNRNTPRSTNKKLTQGGSHIQDEPSLHHQSQIDSNIRIQSWSEEEENQRDEKKFERFQITTIDEHETKKVILHQSEVNVINSYLLSIDEYLHNVNELKLNVGLVTQRLKAR